MRIWLAALALGTGLLPASAGAQHWVGGWATSQMVPTDANIAPDADLTDATLRQIVRITLSGKQIRIRLSNAFGTQPLAIDAASIARSAANRSARIDPASLKRVTFNGAARAIIPAGADLWSDPIPFPVKAGEDLAISLYLPKAPDRQTGHPGSRATSHFAHGNQTAAADLTAAKTAPRWYVIGGIEVDAPGASAVVVLGDSITDGYGVTPDTNQRWPDALMTRLQADPATRNLAVLNAGIGGNRLRLDGTGPNAVARLDREVLSVPGVSHLIVIEGINDLGTLTRDKPAHPEEHHQLQRDMIEALRQIVLRARAHGIKVIGGTIMPDGASGYYHPDAANEADRAAVNAWIRTPGNFDAVVDFDAAMRDPANPTRLRTDLDSGDGLHPSMAGYRAMASVVPLSLLSPKSKDKGTPVPPPAPPEIAFTFDDLPSHAALPQGTTRVEIAQRIIAALKGGNAPATGFINGVKIEQEPASAAVLDLWRAAGLPLGNHGWSHANLNAISDAQFAEELAKNEPILAAKMGSADWHWFRYPFLSEGKDAERRARIRKLLGEKGYKVANVTMGFDDWAYNDVYARCVAKRDNAAIAQMEKAWLAGAAANADRSRAMAKALYGRDIPHVLLMHLGAFDARMMPRLLELYARKGFRFVSLDEAERNEHYRADTNPALAPPPASLDKALAEKGLPIPAAVPMPELAKLCL